MPCRACRLPSGAWCIGSAVEQICCLASKICRMLSVYEPHGILTMGLQNLWDTNEQQCLRTLRMTHWKRRPHSSSSRCTAALTRLRTACTLATSWA